RDPGYKRPKWVSSGGCENFSPSSPGSVYLFKGDSYWKFRFPGSTLQDGYPRSSTADWLDCPDSSSSSPVEGSHIWTQCMCQNGALSGRTTSSIAALLCTGLWKSAKLQTLTMRRED
uniref:Uncharacterized protein n=1 Tax=Sander lucioperca TaxID=283035 RepID=A0A8D0A7X2_SANLU